MFLSLVGSSFAWEPNFVSAIFHPKKGQGRADQYYLGGGINKILEIREYFEPLHKSLSAWMPMKTDTYKFM